MLPKLAAIYNSKFIRWQIGLLILLAALLILGDRSQPKVSSITEVLPTTQPLVISFDRPINQDVFIDSFTATINDQPIEGRLSWSTKSVAFIPARPLPYQQPVAIKVSLQDKNRPESVNHYTTQISTSTARFTYLTADRKLMLYDVERKQSKQLSRDGERVWDYDMSANGLLLVSYRGQNSDQIHGLYTISLQQDQPTYADLEQLSNKYLISRFCNTDQTIVLLENRPDKEFAYDSDLLHSVPVVANIVNQSARQTIVDNNIGYPNNNYLCSQAHHYLTRIDKDSQTLSLQSMLDQQQVAIGPNRRAYGFSGKSGILLLDNTTQQDGRNQRTILSLNPQDGQTEVVSYPDLDITGGQYSYDENYLAVSLQSQPTQDSLNGQGLLAILDRHNNWSTIYRTPTSGTATDQFPSWSANGRYLAFQHIDNDIQVYKLIANSIKDQPLYGAIHIVDTTAVQAGTKPIDLKINGGQVLWLL